VELSRVVRSSRGSPRQSRDRFASDGIAARGASTSEEPLTFVGSESVAAGEAQDLFTADAALLAEREQLEAADDLARRSAPAGAGREDDRALVADAEPSRALHHRRQAGR
jgi:hypothetical protein